MALKETRGKREYDKFVADGSGDTALRVTTTSSVTTSATSSGASATSGSGAGTGVTTAAASETVLVTSTDTAGKERIGIQIFNTGATGTTQNASYKVWGSLVTTPATTVGGSDWTQIGDDIQITNASNGYRAIATTPIKNLGVTGRSRGPSYDGSGSPVDTTSNVYIMAD